MFWECRRVMSHDRSIEVIANEGELYTGTILARQSAFAFAKS
jgi:hypothetical protein